MKDIVVQDGYCYEMVGEKMIPSIVLNADGGLMAGEKWLEDIIAENKERPLQVIHANQFLEYRKDGTEPWRKYPLAGR